uniref:P-loop ATPase, Sll1717 family n=1 Tax=uncultured Sphingomonas sp. TaxID=158754 RepID=UPI0035CB82CE
MAKEERPLNELEKGELARFLTRNEPLGPIAAERMINHELAARKLFERQNDIHSQLFSASGIVIGRRGAGKTAFLDHLRASRGVNEVVYLSAPDVFPSILKSIRGVFGVNSPPVEVVAHLWEMLIWSAVFATLLRGTGDARQVGIRRFANEFDFSEADAPAQVIRQVVNGLKARSAAFGSSIDSRLDLLDLANGHQELYSNALQAAHKIIGSPTGSRRKAEILVLMDTMEDYRLEQDVANDALGGLVRYLGVHAPTEQLIDVRFCLPAELYETFRRASSNSAKDFGTQAVLHWSAGELWRIAAHRLALYLEVHDPATFDLLDADNASNDRAGAIAFFLKLLPNTIECETHVEQSLTHIARHTQLLPRDLIHILNRIVSRAIMPGTGALGEITPKMVVDGVGEAEPIIADGIRSAFFYRYPHFNEICAAAIPELRRRFADGDLHTVFNQSVKGVLKRIGDAGGDAEMSYHDFKRMLIETGVLGKQIDETEMFWECQFEYTVPGEMVVSTQDMLCVHPLFNAVFPSAVNGKSPKLIYPYGALHEND